MDERGARLRTRGDKAVTLMPDEFLRRFLVHVLPKGFVKIRHYGLMASSHATTTLEVARARILAGSGSAPSPPASTKPAHVIDWWARLTALTGSDVTRCPHCG